MTAPADDPPTDWYHGITEKHYDIAVRRAVQQDRKRRQEAPSEPVAYMYMYQSPFDGSPIRRFTSEMWNGQVPYEAVPLYAASTHAEADRADNARDAARYRWLRDRPSLIGWGWWTPTIPHYAVVTSEFMDETIDAAIAAHQPKAPT